MLYLFLPKFKIAFTFLIESVNSCDGGRLVVASQNKDLVGIFDLIRIKETNRFDTLSSSIDIIPQEEVA